MSSTSGQRSRTARRYARSRPGPDLHLDALVALIEVVLDLLEDALDGWLDAEAHARVDLAARAAERSRQRLAAHAGEQVPARHLQAGLGEVIAAHLGPRRRRRRPGAPRRRPARPGPGSRAGCATTSRSSRSSSTGRTALAHSPQPSAPSWSRTRIRMWSRWSLVWLDVVNGRTSGRRTRYSSTDRSVWLIGGAPAGSGAVCGSARLKPTATKPAPKAAWNAWRTACCHSLRRGRWAARLDVGDAGRDLDVHVVGVGGSCAHAVRRRGSAGVVSIRSTPSGQASVVRPSARRWSTTRRADGRWPGRRSARRCASRTGRPRTSRQVAPSTPRLKAALLACSGSNAQTTASRPMSRARAALLELQQAADAGALVRGMHARSAASTGSGGRCSRPRKREGEADQALVGVEGAQDQAADLLGARPSWRPAARSRPR